MSLIAYFEEGFTIGKQAL